MYTSLYGIFDCTFNNFPIYVISDRLPIYVEKYAIAVYPPNKKG
ncbi:hypothetical protein [Funiculus sociatus]